MSYSAMCIRHGRGRIIHSSPVAYRGRRTGCCCLKSVEEELAVDVALAVANVAVQLDRRVVGAATPGVHAQVGIVDLEDEALSNSWQEKEDE